MDDLQKLIQAIETEKCPVCDDSLRLQISIRKNELEYALYSCPRCGWESGFCTPPPERPLLKRNCSK